MATNFEYRKLAVRGLTRDIGVYVLADLDNVPLYVGQSVDGIRQRVQRHLTSARSDIIANRQIDIWEVAYVWEYPSPRGNLDLLEAALFHHFDPKSSLMNGKQPGVQGVPNSMLAPSKVVQVMSSEEIQEKIAIQQRLPRQANHYAEVTSHFLNIKNSAEIARAMNAHFARLSKYHSMMLKSEMTED